MGILRSVQDQRDVFLISDIITVDAEIVLAEIVMFDDKIRSYHIIALFAIAYGFMITKACGLILAKIVKPLPK